MVFPSARIGLIALAALGAAGPADAYDRSPINHYILDCADGCPQKAVEAAIGSPTGITTDAEGSVYFTSQSVAFKLRRDGMLVRIAGTGEPGFSGDGGRALDAKLNIPLSYKELELDSMDYFPFAAGIAVDAGGNVYIADSYNSRVRRVDPGGTIASLADADGKPLDTSWPQGVAVDAAGNVFVSSQWGTISRREPDGRVVDLVAWNCGAGHLGDGACVPEQIALDRAGAIYFGDNYCRVRKWVAGIGTTSVVGDLRHELDTHDVQDRCGYRGDGGPATLAALSYLPYAVAVDALDRLYVADTYNHCVRRVDAAGIITAIAGRCGDDTDGPLGDNGPATAAQLYEPMGVAVDLEGNLYIADTGHRLIRKVTPDGIITTVAGNGEPLPVTKADAARKSQ